MLNEREIKVQLEERIEDITKILSESKDAEIRLIKDGIAVSEINRKRIERKTK